MSSYYTTAQLEEMRKARLKQELEESLQKLKEQLQIDYENNSQITASSHIELSVFIEDDSVEGYIGSPVITGSMLRDEVDKNHTTREVLDFSDFLISANKKPTKLELELDSWIKKVDERPIVREKDEKDRTRLLAELAKIINSSSIDIEDKIKSVKMRVQSYLQCALTISKADEEKINSMYFKYIALCEMLEVTPTERFPYRVEREVARMTSILEKRRQDEYIMEVIEEIMGNLGCHVKDNAVLDHTVGQMYAVDGHPLCDVFIGNDGSGIMFEPVGESKGGSLEKQRQIERSANQICSLYAILEERAAEKGVILKRVYIESADIDEMYVQSDISEISIKKKERKTTTQKQRTLNSEG